MHKYFQFGRESLWALLGPEGQSPGSRQSRGAEPLGASAPGSGLHILVGTEDCDELWTNHTKCLGNPLQQTLRSRKVMCSWSPCSCFQFQIVMGKRNMQKVTFLLALLRPSDSEQQRTFFTYASPCSPLSLPVLLLSLPFPGAAFPILTPAGYKAMRGWVNSFRLPGSGSDCSRFWEALGGSYSLIWGCRVTHQAGSVLRVLEWNRVLCWQWSGPKAAHRYWTVAHSKTNALISPREVQELL